MRWRHALYSEILQCSWGASEHFASILQLGFKMWIPRSRETDEEFQRMVHTTLKVDRLTRTQTCMLKLTGQAGPKNINRRGVRPEEQEADGDTSHNPLHEVFLEDLADIQNAEQQLTKALPKMVSVETKQQALRLEEVEASMKRKKCKGMKGLPAEVSRMVRENKGDENLHAVIIAGAQKVAHYEIASYGISRPMGKANGSLRSCGALESDLGRGENGRRKALRDRQARRQP